MPNRPSRWTAARLMLPLAAGLALLMLCGAAPAAAASPFGRALDRLETSLRVAVEETPAPLASSLTASERVCEIGAGAEAAGEAASADADWSTLGQLVERLGEPQLGAVEAAFRRARSNLDRLQKAFRRGWAGDRARIGALRVAVGAARQGILRVTASFPGLATAFAGWRGRQCESALAAIAAFQREAGLGVARIGLGMERLWALSEM